MTTQSIQVGVSIGELMDKITILEIKAARISDPKKLRNVTRELDELLIAAKSLEFGATEMAIVDDLKSINILLWDVEDAIRECDYTNDFSDRFIELARSVYQHNDRRAELKKKLNELMGSALVEEKSYSMRPEISPAK